jgi:hypothetical protein
MPGESLARHLCVRGQDLEAVYCRGVRRQPIALALVVVVLFVLFVSGLRQVPGVPYAISPPFCGPITDQFGSPAGDAGPCPSVRTPLLGTSAPQWEWVPFWFPPQPVPQGQS